MNAENIKHLLAREPFAPFRLILTSGTRYDVRNPSLVMVLANEVFIAFPDGERWAHVPLFQISSLELLTNGAPRKNGRRKRK